MYIYIYIYVGDSPWVMGWALMGRALMGLVYMYIYIYYILYIYIYII